MTQTTHTPPHLRTHRIARALSTILQPTLSSVYLLFIVGITTDAPLGRRVLWFILLACISAGIPFVFLLFQVRRGRIGDVHVAVREQRPGPLLVGLAAVCAGFLAALLGRAPLEFTMSLLMALTCGVVLTLITLCWKISFHSAVLAGATVVLVWIFGPWGLLGVAPTAAVAWSRLELHRHTPAQVVGGALVAYAVGTVTVACALAAGI